MTAGIRVQQQLECGHISECLPQEYPLYHLGPSAESAKDTQGYADPGHIVAWRSKGGSTFWQTMTIRV